MAPRARVKAQRPATPEDLESLVRALGPLIAESVRKELAPMQDYVAMLKDEFDEVRTDLARLEGCIRDVTKQLNTSLALENQRLAKERDLEHRAWLGKIDLARAPNRTGITAEQRADADAANAKFLADQEEMRLADARTTLAAGVELHDAATLKLPETVNGIVVPERPDVQWAADIRCALEICWDRIGTSATKDQLFAAVMVEMKGRCNPRQVEAIIADAFPRHHQFEDKPKRERGGMLGP